MKRILLFVMTNVAIVAVLGIVTSVFGFNRFLTAMVALYRAELANLLRTRDAAFPR